MTAALIAILFALLMVALALATIIISISLYIRRWHDLGQSGWMTLLLFIPIVGVGVLIYLCFAKGTDSANQYGEPNVGQPLWRSVFKPASLAAMPTQVAATVTAPQPAPATVPAPQMNSVPQEHTPPQS